MKILAIGATGFVGSHVTRQLRLQGHQVALFHRGNTTASDLDSIIHFYGTRNQPTTFYKQGLGLPAKEEFEGVTFFNLRGTWLAFYPREALATDAQVLAAGNGFPGFTLAHNVKSKEAVDRILQQAEAAGAAILKPGQDTDWGGYLWEVPLDPYLI